MTSSERMAVMSPFDRAPEFIEWDNRQNRKLNPVSKEQMHRKHEVLFPPDLVRGKTILDLGCALGATGYWCLSAGAKRYRGVESQQLYASKGRELLEKYYPGLSTIDMMPIEECLNESNDTYDIVSVLGVLYVFTDYYSVLKKICSRAKEMVVIESQYPFGPHFRPGFVGVEFREDQDINLADENASLQGRGARISPLGLAFIMKEFGFQTDGQLFPKPIKESLDVYNSMNVRGPRFLMRFTRSKEKQSDLSTDLMHGKSGVRYSW